MISHETEDRLIAAAQVFLMLAAVSFFLVMLYRQWSVSRECLALGYPSSSAVLLSPSYCIKRLDQTDVVVPLTEARKGKK